jgi:Flp pilus assembly protein TadG
MRSLLTSFRQFLSGSRARAGNVAIIFSLAVVPIVGGIGAAVDYSTANSNRTSMQKALDSTALALAKLMPLTQTELDTKGWQIFSANLGALKVDMPQSGLVITTPVIGKIHLVATGTYTPQISGFIGVQSFPVGATSEVQWGMKKLELALALDNTGSMESSNKMTELKKAAKNLLTTLQKSVMKPGDVKVSIIPFHKEVRVSVSGYSTVNQWYNLGSSWVRWDLWEEVNGSCNKGSDYRTKSDCEAKKVCTKSQYTKRSTCEDNHGNWIQATWTPADKSTWNGCLEDRDQNNDASDNSPSTTATKFPARQCTYSLATMMPLNYDWTALAAKIDAMQPDGNTNVSIGLAWAWHSLTIGEPFTQAAVPANDLSKYIILMTDGENTQNRWSSNANTIDARTAATCTAVKNAGIKIYTIRVIDGDATLLRNCASDPSMYFDVQNATQLTSVFNSIGATLAQLHLSQ